MERLEEHVGTLPDAEEQIHRMIRLMPDAELEVHINMLAASLGRDPQQPASSSGGEWKDVSPAEQREALQYVQELHRIYLQNLRAAAVSAQDGRHISS
jgi:hypothetical protein